MSAAPRDRRSPGLLRALGWWRTLTARRSDALAGAGEAIAGCNRALARLATAVEEKFVAMGSTLQAQAGLTRTLVTHGGRLAGLASAGEGDDPVTHAVRFARQTLETMAACHGERHQLLARLDTYHDRTGRLLQEEAQVERILAPLRVIQTFFRIESARLPVEMQTGFQALSVEIPKFEQQVRETFGRHAESLSDTCRRIEAACARMRAEEAEQQRTVAADRERLARTLATFADEAGAARTRQARLSDLVGEIDGEARQLVVGLQYQDITRQKMEHIREALGELPAVDSPSSRGATAAAGFGSTCTLEAAHCEAVAEELDRALDGIDRGARAIRDRLARIEAGCWSRQGFPRAVADASARVDAIETILAELKSVALTVMAGADDALQVVSGFESVAADVATTARDMAESMRLIALNAQVLAAQAGAEGAGLLVLAERTYEISEEIRRITESISREFAEASAALATVFAQRDRMEQHAGGCRQAFEVEGLQLVQRLRHSRDETVAALEAIAGGLEQLDRHNAAMSAAAAARPALVGELARIRQGLDELARRSGARPGTVGAAVAHLTRRYTMATEREVHAAACGHAATAPVAPSVAATVAAASELGDNVELF